MIDGQVDGSMGGALVAGAPVAVLATPDTQDERASIAAASNLPFSEWTSIFPDARLAAAVVDRLTYRAHIIETGSSSYRLRATERSRKGGAATA